MLAPVFFCLAVLLGCVLRYGLASRLSPVQGPKDTYSIWKKGALAALPTVLLVSFLAFPIVSSVAFQGLPYACVEFEESPGVQKRYLKADYAIDCDNAEIFQPVVALSWVGIVRRFGSPIRVLISTRLMF